MATSLYVYCKVSVGLFETEYYVFLGTSTALVSKDDVVVTIVPKKAEEQVDGKVRAYVVGMHNNQTLVELSGEPVVGGLRTWVPTTALAG
jgi:hypothetical protein